MLWIDRVKRKGKGQSRVSESMRERERERKREKERAFNCKFTSKNHAPLLKIPF